MAMSQRPAPDYVGFWDADLATPLKSIEEFVRVLDRNPRVEMVVGTWMPLLGRDIRRKPIRHRLGRLFAGVASAALGLRIYDTQCGAKLFRTSDAMTAIFDEEFLARWIFDVEILGRAIDARRDSDLPPLDEVVYELPLDQWHDVAGSKLKSGDFLKAVFELAAIYWRYLRPRRQRSRPAETPPAVLPLPQQPAPTPTRRRAA